MKRVLVFVATAGVVVQCMVLGGAEAGGPADEPAVTVRGQTYTPRSILARNMGSEEDQTTAFPPHKIAGNVYYVGTRTLSSFLITTPGGHVLINTTYERNVRTIERSVAQLGFKFQDIRIVLGTHAHGDHQEGDALAKEIERRAGAGHGRGRAGAGGHPAGRQGAPYRAHAERSANA